MWFFPGFGIRPGRKATWSKVLQVLRTRGSTSEDKNRTEIETYEHYGEKIHETEESIPKETSQVFTVFNKTILLHHEDDSSDGQSVIEIEPSKENGEQEIG